MEGLNRSIDYRGVAITLWPSHWSKLKLQYLEYGCCIVSTESLPSFVKNEGGKYSLGLDIPFGVGNWWKLWTLVLFDVILSNWSDAPSNPSPFLRFQLTFHICVLSKFAVARFNMNSVYSTWVDCDRSFTVVKSTLKKTSKYVSW